MSDSNSNSFLWFLAGLGVGAVAGVLYAPRSGNETREALRSKAEEGREYMRHRARDVRSQANDWVDRGRDILNQQKDQFRAAYDAGRQAYHETTTEASGGNAAKNL
jgi:gas vesicle protein